MYCSFFGFREKPFEVTPDPKFLFITPVYQEILSALMYGIRERRGIIAIVGDVGTGKTLMLKTALERMELKTKAVMLCNSDLTFKQLLFMALCDLGLAKPNRDMGKGEAIQRLRDFAIQQSEIGGNVVLIIDEAQNLSRKVIENLRMLSNFEAQNHNLIQIVLSGQNELDDILGAPKMRQMVQRISLKRYSRPLSNEETLNYIYHRLQVAGYEGTTLFTKASLKMICKYSEGLPRKINIICDNALLIGYGIAEQTIDAPVIEEVINDLGYRQVSNLLRNDEKTSRRFSGRAAITPSRVLVAAGIVGLVILLSALVFQSGFSTPGDSSSRVSQSSVEAGRK